MAPPLPGTGEFLTHFVRTFEANAIHLVQQRVSKFRGKVTEKGPSFGPSEKHSFRTVQPRVLPPVERPNVGLVAGKRPATNFLDTVVGERVALSKPYNTADSFSKPDLRRMLEDPQSVIYRAMIPQIARFFDDTIIAAMYADATDTLGNVYPFGTGAIAPTIATGAGGTAEAFKFDAVAMLLESFNTQEVDPDEQKFLAVPPAVVTKILSEEKATSVDYVNAKALMSGQVVDGWMGFTWLMSNRLTAPAPGEMYCPSWTRDAMGLLVLGDINTEIGKSPTQQFDTIIQLDIDIGAVRIQDEKVKRIHCLATPMLPSVPEPPG